MQANISSFLALKEAMQNQLKTLQDENVNLHGILKTLFDVVKRGGGQRVGKKEKQTEHVKEARSQSKFMTRPGRLPLIPKPILIKPSSLKTC